MYTLVVCPKSYPNQAPAEIYTCVDIGRKHCLIQIHTIQTLGASSSSTAIFYCLLEFWVIQMWLVKDDILYTHDVTQLHSGEFTLTVFMCAWLRFGPALYGCAFNTFLCINSAPAVQQRRFLSRRKQDASFLLSKEEFSLTPRSDVNGLKCGKYGTCALFQSTPMKFLF